MEVTRGRSRKKFRWTDGEGERKRVLTVSGDGERDGERARSEGGKC